MRVPFLDLGATYRELSSQFDECYRRVTSSGWFLLGPELEAFEQEWAHESGATSCAGVGSGLDALVLALRVLDVGPGDEVIVPSNTYIATWLAVTAVGARVIPVEPDTDSLNISAESISQAISPRTAAFLPVHLYGRPAQVEAIDSLSRRTGIPVVYDGAQAHGASADGAPVGSFGTLTAWSFYPGKNLGAFSDAGAVTSNDSDLISRVKRLRNYGSEVKYFNIERGTNSRLDELQAAFLSVKLQYLKSWNARRKAFARSYLESLQNLELQLPSSTPVEDSSWHLFVVQSERRDWLKTELQQRGIETLIHYPVAPHLQAAYADHIFPSLEIAESLALKVLSLPIGPHLSVNQSNYVISALNELLT